MSISKLINGLFFISCSAAVNPGKKMSLINLLIQMKSNIAGKVPENLSQEEPILGNRDPEVMTGYFIGDIIANPKPKLFMPFLTPDDFSRGETLPLNDSDPIENFHSENRDMVVGEFFEGDIVLPKGFKAFRNAIVTYGPVSCHL